MVDIAFVWHMHQPYYRSSRGAPFDMPWARMHALKDYLGMLEILGEFPDLHQTFNLVPSLVEQLEAYATGDFADVYWDHTLKPASELSFSERAFIVGRMCERSDHPRTSSHPRYVELARKREGQASQGPEACAASFSVEEIRDLQIWFNLAWFGPKLLEEQPLSDLVSRGRLFSEEDKAALATVQRDLLVRTLPAYKGAALRGQVELTTSPYFHPILPLLINSDSARVATGDVLLPRRRFAHPEDALEQLHSAADKHSATFGERPRGVWCSEQAVGEDVIPLLVESGFEWTISDETVLARSLAGVVRTQTGALGGATSSSKLTLPLGPDALYTSYRLERQTGELSIVFRDHTLSDLIGFVYRSWASKDAAVDLLGRLRHIRSALVPTRGAAGTTPHESARGGCVPLVTIALDGENAWEYYTRNGADFLRYLYEGLTVDPRFRCVTVTEHLRENPAPHRLDWLHTGSWIGGDLRTWIGDSAHGKAWDLLVEARDVAARDKALTSQETSSAGKQEMTAAGERETPSKDEEAWWHILVSEGSDWFWWFGEHHHTELDAVWDSSFRRHLEHAYRLLDKSIPTDLLFPVLSGTSTLMPVMPKGPIAPVIDGVVGPTQARAEGEVDEWANAGYLATVPFSTMQRAGSTLIREVRFGWDEGALCLLLVPDSPSSLRGLEIHLEVQGVTESQALRFVSVLEDGGQVRTECRICPQAATNGMGAWKEVVELSLPLSGNAPDPSAVEVGLVVQTGRDGMIDQVFHSTRAGCQGG
ncbi:MAG: glycoside hydrolase family 57 protein [Actinobacteria bacterium]|nr:glycoside hydrolase family 57 protein [Actinomycetota bacterium]